MAKDKKLPVCPYCGSKKVKQIDDFYECTKCRRDFGRDATSDAGLPLTEAVDEIRFRFGDTISGNVRIRILEMDGSVRYEVYDSNGGGVDKKSGSIDEKDWKALKETLFNELYIQDWDAMYLPRNDGKAVRENNSWELIYAVGEDEQHEIHGTDAYPVYWDRLMGLMDPYFHQLAKD
jgi:DNA-directed RNA polymerase subunit RPC12/RpoP